MCYSGKCYYEDHLGECTRNMKINPIKYNEPIPLCYVKKRKEDNSMKIINKNKKLKYSKMFIDKKIYEQICKDHGVDYSEHLRELELCARKPDYVPSMDTVAVMMDIYINITKIIRKR